jgi:hypothetical protein
VNKTASNFRLVILFAINIGASHARFYWLVAIFTCQKWPF